MFHVKHSQKYFPMISLLVPYFIDSHGATKNTEKRACSRFFTTKSLVCFVSSCESQRDWLRVSASANVHSLKGSALQGYANRHRLRIFSSTFPHWYPRPHQVSSQGVCHAIPYFPAKPILPRYAPKVVSSQCQGHRPVLGEQDSGRVRSGPEQSSVPPS